MSDPKTELKLEIRAFASNWCSETHPIQFHQDLRKMLKEIASAYEHCDEGFYGWIGETMEDALR